MRRLVGLGAGAEEAEDGGAGAGHAGEYAALGCGDTADKVADGGDQLDGGRLKIVAGAFEPKAQLGGPRQRIGQRLF